MKIISGKKISQNGWVQLYEMADGHYKVGHVRLDGLHTYFRHADFFSLTVAKIYFDLFE